MDVAEAEILLNPFGAIAPFEEQAMEVDAFLGALDDLFLEYKSTGPERRPDKEIMQMVYGIRDQASVHYSAERTETLFLFAQVSERLGAMALNHECFGHALEKYSISKSEEGLSKLQSIDPNAFSKHSQEDGHAHAGTDVEADGLDPRKKTKKKAENTPPETLIQYIYRMIKEAKLKQTKKVVTA